MDENHCLSVTASEEAKNANAIYDRLLSLCSQETLAIRRTTMEQMLRANEYMQYSFARNQRWLLSHVTEHFLPDDTFKELTERYCQAHKDADRAALMRAHKLSMKMLENMKLRMLLSEDGMSHFAVSGRVDFFGDKMTLTPEQRLRCLEYAADLPERNPNLDYRVLRNRGAEMLRNIPSPTLFLSDSFSYMRIHRSGPFNNLSVLNNAKISKMFLEYYDDLWRMEEFVASDYHSAVELIRYAVQMVQVQIFAEEDN